MAVGGVYGGVVFTLLGMAMFPGIQGLFYDYPCHAVCWVPYLLSCISSQPRYFSFHRILSFLPHQLEERHWGTHSLERIEVLSWPRLQQLQSSQRSLSMTLRPLRLSAPSRFQFAFIFILLLYIFQMPDCFLMRERKKG